MNFIYAVYDKLNIFQILKISSNNVYYEKFYLIVKLNV